MIAPKIAVSAEVVFEPERLEKEAYDILKKCANGHGVSSQELSVILRRFTARVTATDLRVSLQ